MKLTTVLALVSCSTGQSFVLNHVRRVALSVHAAGVSVTEDPTPPSEEPVVAEAPRSRTLEDDLPQLAMENELSSFVEIESGAKSQQKLRLSAVQSRLMKTMELKDRVENLFVDEIEGIIEKLDAEGVAEGVRAADIDALASKFKSVLDQKREAVERDEELLAALRSTQGMVREASIQSTMQSAIDDKATLCLIERELIGKMEQCLKQLDEEFVETTSRKAKMEEVRASLPSVGDKTAVRSYSWSDIEALNTVLVENAESALQREAAVEGIKSDFASAMDRRRRILSGEPALPPAPPRRDLSAVRSSSGPTTTAGGAAQSGSSSPSDTASSGASSSSSSSLPVLSNDELATELKEAVAELAASVTEVTGSVVAAAATFLGSAETKATVASTTGAFGGALDAAKAAASTWDAVVEETVSANVMTAGQSTSSEGASEGDSGSYGSGGDNGKEWWMKVAFEKVRSSPEVRDSLNKASSEAKNALDSLGKAGSALGKPATDSKLVKTSGPADVLPKAVVRLARAISALVGRIAGTDDGSSSLPPGR